VLLVACGTLLGCVHEEKPEEIAYVSAPQTFIRDRVAPVYQRVATVRNTDRVVVLDRSRRFALVRLESGEEGWLQERYLISRQVYEVAQKLPDTTRSLPVQARAVTRAAVNLHILPGRETPYLYQLKGDESLEVLKRAVQPRDQAAAPPLDPAQDETAAAPEAPAVPLEDWWLVRTADGGRAGWVLGRLIFLDLPLEVAQYSEGARIVAYFVLNEVSDGDRKIPQYLVLYTDPRDGQPFDFNQVRVFSWNLKRHRYETAYRERNLKGVLPALVTTEDFGREGVLPVFSVAAQDAEGILQRRRYRLIGPIVRRITEQVTASLQTLSFSSPAAPRS
jgi:hypothetical protein